MDLFSFGGKMAANRPDRDGWAEREYRKNRKIIIAREEVCALCGLPVDKHLKFPHPRSATADHIIPVAKGGHPSALANLQLAHLNCNQLKAAKLVIENHQETADTQQVFSNRILPQSLNWSEYKG